MELESQSFKKSPLSPQFPLNALIVEDQLDDVELCLRALRKANYEVQYKVFQKQRH